MTKLEKFDQSRRIVTLISSPSPHGGPMMSLHIFVAREGAKRIAHSVITLTRKELHTLAEGV